MNKEPQDRILNKKTIKNNKLSARGYKYGFTTDVDTDSIPKG